MKVRRKKDSILVNTLEVILAGWGGACIKGRSLCQEVEPGWGKAEVQQQWDFLAATHPSRIRSPFQRSEPESPLSGSQPLFSTLDPAPAPGLFSD